MQVENFLQILETAMPSKTQFMKETTVYLSLVLVMKIYYPLRLKLQTMRKCAE